jgi:hypothetical protein
MRKLLGLAMVAGLIAMGGYVRDARAGVTIDLMFVGHNGFPIVATDTVAAAPNDTLTMAVLMRNDQTLTIAVYSLNYDLDGDNELDVVSVFGWGGVPLNKTATDFFAPLIMSPTTATFVGSFSGSTTNFGPPPRLLPASAGAFAGGYQMGTVTWKVNAGVNNDGTDILSGLLNPGVDGIFDNAFQPINALQFNAATVNFIPEPGTASLLGLGLVGLVLLGRRSRS